MWAKIGSTVQLEGPERARSCSRHAHGWVSGSATPTFRPALTPLSAAPGCSGSTGLPEGNYWPTPCRTERHGGRVEGRRVLTAAILGSQRWAELRPGAQWARTGPSTTLGAERGAPCPLGGCTLACEERVARGLSGKQFKNTTRKAYFDKKKGRIGRPYPDPDPCPLNRPETSRRDT